MSAPVAGEESPLALICGSGSLPLAVADSVAARGRRVLLFPLRGIAAPQDYAGRAPIWLQLAKFGTFIRAARAAGCRDLVLIGSLVRPSFWQLRFDLTTLRMLPGIAASFRGGDDHLLSGVARLIEGEGFRLLGAHEVAPEILVPKGVLGRVQPTPQDETDAALGFRYLHATGMFDVGQAVVVASNRVLAVEAAEGTDQMLVRVAELRRTGRLAAGEGRGVLVKCPKPTQDRRFDLPSIGPQTIKGVASAGLAGVAVAAGETIAAQSARLVEIADRENVFVAGLASGLQR
ncbi:MAG TPA: UDP-2,3-diacylglucosamine diphosphatase LpxI [Pseudolabrys sp.]|nr:UDP-2,3-diacylglucosamine diphosphatase LpxI [Pseudolabrys sp.]